MSVTLEEVKQYLRIDGSEDDNFLTSLITAADEYLFDAGVRSTISFRYKLAVMLLVSEWYENRTIRGVSSDVSYSVNSIILQLREVGI